MKVEVLVETIHNTTNPTEVLAVWREIQSTCSINEQVWAHKLVSKKLLDAIMEVR